MKSKAIYPGSFDPFTLGHLDVVKRACELFDCVIIAVANNTQKDPLFDVATRLALIEEAVRDLPNVSVESFDGLTVNFAKQKMAKAVVRGLRAISDFEYEFQMSQMNKTLYPEIETVYVMASLDYTFLSSSMVKEVIQLGGNVDNLVPDCVRKALSALKLPQAFDSQTLDSKDSKKDLSELESDIPQKKLKGEICH